MLKPGQKQVSIVVDQKSWKMFKVFCASQSVSASGQVASLIQEYVRGLTPAMRQLALNYEEGQQTSGQLKNASGVHIVVSNGQPRLVSATKKKKRIVEEPETVTREKPVRVFPVMPPSQSLRKQDAPEPVTPHNRKFVLKGRA